MTLAEVMVSAALTMCVTGAVFSIVEPVHGLVQAQPEASDLHQRVRVVIDTLTRAILNAGAVLPYRAGGSAPDPPGSFRPGTISTIATSQVDIYSLEPTATGGSLIHDAGEGARFPVADHVVGLSFEFFGGADQAMPALLDPAAAAGGAVPIRRVRVHLRVQAGAASLRGRAGPLFTHAGTSTSSQRLLPDLELQFDVAPRNR